MDFEISTKTDASENNGRWNSVTDALEAISSLSRVTGGSDSYSSTVCTESDQLEKASGTVKADHQFSQSSFDNADERSVDEASNFGAGRGRLLRELEKQFSRQQLDQNIHADLRVVVGPGYSNELIEHYFGTASTSPNEFGSEGTSNLSDCDIEENEADIDIVVGESDLMKKVTEAEKSATAPKKTTKPLRCRNAIILNLMKKKLMEEIEQGKKEPLLLKGPDVFLPHKSYSTALLETDTCTSTSDKPLFTIDDFPAL